MSSLLATLSLAQTSDTTKVQDVYIVRPGGGFANITDSTYYAIPRYRVERLLRDAQLGDSIKVMWIHSEERQASAIEHLESQRSFWKTTSIVSAVVAALELIIILVGR